MIQAIINKNGNNWKAFPVLFVLSTLGCLVGWLGVDVPKGRDAAAQWATEQRGTGAVDTVFSDEKDSDFPESKSEGRAIGRSSRQAQDGQGAGQG